MGDAWAGPGVTAASGDAAEAFAQLDEVLWDPIARATLLRSNPRFDERVLDAEAGDGATALPTAELVGPGGVVDAVDRSEAMIGRLRDRAGERMPQLRTHVGDATTWPYTGYDLVQCVLGVASFPDLDAGTRHLIERAAPGGRVAIAVWAPGAFEPVRELLTTALHDGDAAAEPDGDVAAEPDGDAGAEPDADVLHSPGSFAHWLTGLGLVGVRAETVQRHLDLTDEIAWSLVLGTELRDALDDLDDDAVAGVRERFLAALAVRGATPVDLTTLIAVGQRPA